MFSLAGPAGLVYAPRTTSDTEASQTPMNPSARTRRRGAREAGADDAAARQRMSPAATVDRAAFPDLAARLAVDGGAASARFRALLAEGRPDPRRRRDGHDALRGRPPVRRPAGGLEPHPARRRAPDPARLSRGRLADPADQHLRRQPPAARAPRPRGSRRRAEPDGGDPAPRRGRRRRRRGARRRRHRPVRARSWRPLGTLDEDEAVDVFARAGGRADRGRRRPDLDRDDVRPRRDRGGDPRASGGPRPASRSSRR